MKELVLRISGTPIQGGVGVPTGGEGTLEKIIQLGIGYLILAAIFLSLIFLIWGGLNWIMSEGDKQRLAQAHQKIVFAIIGLIIVFLAFLVINIIQQFFNVPLITIPFGGGGGGGRSLPR